MVARFVKRVTLIGIAMAALNASPVLAGSMSPQEIMALYADSSSFSVDGANINYYASDGTFKTTNIKTGKAGTAGKWYVTNKSNLCIVSHSERCWKITQTKTKVCFSAHGKQSCRAKDAYIRGDQTSAYVKK